MAMVSVIFEGVYTSFRTPICHTIQLTDLSRKETANILRNFLCVGLKGKQNYVLRGNLYYCTIDLRPSQQLIYSYFFITMTAL